MNLTKFLHDETLYYEPGALPTEKLIADAKDLAGLNLCFDGNDNLIYDTENPYVYDENGNIRGSKKLRDFLMDAIDHPETVTINYSPNDWMFAYPKGKLVDYSPSRIEKLINGSSEALDDRTMGYVMSFVHELRHTKVGGSLKHIVPAVIEPKTNKDIVIMTHDPVLSLQNEIRLELSEYFQTNFGQLQSIILMKDGNQYVWPFSRETWFYHRNGYNKRRNVKHLEIRE